MAPHNDHNQFHYTKDSQQTHQPFAFPGVSKPIIVEAPITEEIINKVTQIVNEFIPNTTTIYDNIDDAANAMGVDSNTNGAQVGGAVTESLIPDFVSQAGNGTGEVVTEVKELMTNFDGDSLFGSITTTIRNYISDNDEDRYYHNGIHGGSMEHHAHPAKSDPYLYLVIVLAVLVVLATVALLLYIRHKRSASAKISPGISIVGKTFEPHTFGDKTLAGQSALPEQYGACDDAGQPPKPSKSKSTNK